MNVRNLTNIDDGDNDGDNEENDKDNVGDSNEEAMATTKGSIDAGLVV